MLAAVYRRNATRCGDLGTSARPEATTRRRSQFCAFEVSALRYSAHRYFPWMGDPTKWPSVDSHTVNLRDRYSAEAILIVSALNGTYATSKREYTTERHVTTSLFFRCGVAVQALSCS